MADLGTYFGLGYRLDITSQLATTYAEARTTFTLGNQTSLGTAGVVTASGVAQFYAITNPVGSVLVEAAALVTGQPVIAGFSFTVQNFETAPKIIPQGHDAQGASQRIRSRKPKDTKPEETAGKKLNKALDEALAPPVAPEPIVEVTVEAPSPVLPKPETPQPPAQAEVVTEPKTITYTPPSSDVLEAGRELAARRAELASGILAKQQAERTARADAVVREAEALAVAERQAKEREEAQRRFEEEQRQDEEDALKAIEAMMQSLEAPEPKQQPIKVEDMSKAFKEAVAELVASKPKTITIKRGPDGRITGGMLS